MTAAASVQNRKLSNTFFYCLALKQIWNYVLDDKWPKMDNIYLWKIAFIELRKHLFVKLYTLCQENDTSNDVWLIITGIDIRKEKAKQKACPVSLREFWFA